MTPCNEPSAVLVCGHVNDGQQFDFLIVGDDGLVDTAVCDKCREEMELSISVQHEYEAMNKLHELMFKTMANIRGMNICRACARKLGIPDTTPFGQNWERNKHCMWN